MTEIRVPTLGESVTEATIGRWFKKAGDAVAVDEPLVELETDKVTIEVPAPSAGVLGDIIAKDGETGNRKGSPRGRGPPPRGCWAIYPQGRANPPGRARCPARKRRAGPPGPQAGRRPPPRLPLRPLLPPPLLPPPRQRRRPTRRW